jgi:hypothetical protein
MTTIYTIFSQADAALAERIQTDLRAAQRHTIHAEASTERDALAVVLLSPAALRDTTFMNALYAALDAGQRLVPVLAQTVAVPKLIDHLPIVDVTDSYEFAVLNGQIEAALASESHTALRVRTPRVQQSNQRIGVFLIGLVIALFIFSSWAIATFDIEAPQEEYDRVDTEVAGTRDMLIFETMQYLSTALPRSTEQAQAFPATVEAVGTRVQPFFAFTATAIHNQLAQFAATPTPAAPEGD